MDRHPLTNDAPGRVRLTTARLILLSVDPAQAETLAAGGCPLPCAPGYPHADTSAAARLLRQSIEVDNWVPGFGMYLIVRSSDGLVIGDIGFHTPPDERGAAEVAYGLAPSARHRGYASEALDALTSWAHCHGCETVLAEVEPDNVASVAVLERCGYAPVRAAGPWLRYRHQRG
ncbi:Protein N-acetyltransferase, RimJ/RimL family [Propionibacterium cyclohexanicum]|mgnify:CR=1 FL=1|uniref:Protein N-acetyltransferase, RimJ/RimL family n=1 Tax=Propionibacterium cyclohexanicum TaxID=64702 RepID=A0A1H9S232_9ACTN|nr:GNAT family N-acetyltransferase [Propionibacterium cyclohexanicum]SER79061.1 Protein N-acetyltransferase, RimJ/RimL family [Propionibacterium cyclohexanicum]